MLELLLPPLLLDLLHPPLLRQVKGIIAENKKIPNDITYPSYAMQMYINEY